MVPFDTSDNFTSTWNAPLPQASGSPFGHGLQQDHLGRPFFAPKHPGYIIGEQVIRPVIDFIANLWSNIKPSTLLGRFGSLHTTLSPRHVTLLLQNIAGYRCGLPPQAQRMMNLMQLALVVGGEKIDSEQGEALVDQGAEVIFEEGCDSDHSLVKEAGGLDVILERGFALNREGKNLFSMKKYAEATKAFHTAMEIFISINQYDLSLGLCLTNLGLCYLYQGNHEKALEMLTRGLNVKRYVLKGDHILVAESLTNLGTCLHTLNRFEEALNFFREATNVKRKILKEKDPSLGHSILDEANILCILDNYEEAFKKYEEALKIASSNNQQAVNQVKQNLEICKEKRSSSRRGL